MCRGGSDNPLRKSRLVTFDEVIKVVVYIVDPSTTDLLLVWRHDEVPSLDVIEILHLFIYWFLHRGITKSLE